MTKGSKKHEAQPKQAWASLRSHHTSQTNRLINWSKLRLFLLRVCLISVVCRWAKCQLNLRSKWRWNTKPMWCKLACNHKLVVRRSANWTKWMWSTKQKNDVLELSFHSNRASANTRAKATHWWNCASTFPLAFALAQSF